MTTHLNLLHPTPYLPHGSDFAPSHLQARAPTMSARIYSPYHACASCAVNSPQQQYWAVAPPTQYSSSWGPRGASHIASRPSRAGTSLATVVNRPDGSAETTTTATSVGNDACAQNTHDSAFTCHEPVAFFPPSHGYDFPPSASAADDRPPVVKLPRAVAAEVEAKVAVAERHIAVVESITARQLQKIHDQVARFRQVDRYAIRQAQTDCTHTNGHRPTSAVHTARSPRRDDAARTRPLLHVFGDSFVGPFTLYRPAEVRVTKYKGASAQGLGSPHSALQVGTEVAHRVREYITAPGNRSKAALLMFGSVDLHINHLHHVTTKSVARHLRDERGKRSTLPVDAQAMTGIEYADRALESYKRFLLNDIVRSETGDFVRDHAYDASPPLILIAAAAPPMVEDRYLEAIRLKYILPHQSKPIDWAERDPSPSPPSTPSASRSSTASLMSRSSSPSSLSSTVDDPLSVREILEQGLGLLDLASRIEATRHFNAELRGFCQQHGDVLHFVDITPSMACPDPSDVAGQAIARLDVDRARFGDKADPTNVHVDWEATLPLWEEELGWAGVRVEEFKYRTSLEETARAFSAEKAERVKRRSWKMESDASPRTEGKLEKGKVSVRVESVPDEPVSGQGGKALACAGSDLQACASAGS